MARQLLRYFPALQVAGIVLGVRSGLRRPRRLTVLAIADEAPMAAFYALRVPRAVQWRRPRIAAGSALVAVGAIARPKTAKNRVHLDVQAGGGRGEPQETRWARVLQAVRDLTQAGASVIREDLQDGIPDHLVMADPEGNEFCVV